MIKCALAWTQVSVGISYPILETPCTVLPHLGVKWIAFLHKFLASIYAGQLLDDPNVPEIQRQGDSHTMDHILESKIFYPTEIRKINYCCLYLQAISMADLAMATCEALDSSKLVGQVLLQSGRISWIPINQERPSETVWVMWTQANLLWSTAEGQLHIPLKTGSRPSTNHETHTSHTTSEGHDRYDININNIWGTTASVPCNNAHPKQATTLHLTRHLSKLNQQVKGMAYS